MHYCIRCGQQLSLQTADGKTVCENCRTDYSSGATSFYREFGSVSFRQDCAAQWRETAEAGFCSSCGSKWESKRVVSFCLFCGKPLMNENEEQSAGTIEAPRKAIRSGYCGGNVRYTLDSDGTLTISGSGKMWALGWRSSFYNNSSIKTVVIGSGVTSISDGAFRRCTGLTNITIPSSVTSIGDLAFKDCTGLKSVVIPNGITSIAYRTFEGCTGLTSITVPDTVISIGTEAFSGLKELKDIWIPATIRKIENYAFDSCPLLTIHGVPGSRAQKYARKNGIPFSADTVPHKPRTGTTDGNNVQQQIMYCIACGATLTDLTKPCPGCGRSLSPEEKQFYLRSPQGKRGS